MRKLLLLIILVSTTLLLHEDLSAQKKEKEKSGIKKMHLLPVYLVYSGLPMDTAFDRMVKEGFSRHNVKVITYAEFDQLNKNEVSRIETKFRARSNEFGSEREIREAIEKEQRFASNMLVITFTINRSFLDSITVTGASWEATPYPPNIISGRTSGDIKTVLENTCCTPQDNLFAIIDMILFSKWLR